MDQRKTELQRISKDLERFLGEHCKPTPDGYHDFVGESCDMAFQMLQDTLRRMSEAEAAQKNDKKKNT
jgi:hypothetical protein